MKFFLFIILSILMKSCCGEAHAMIEKTNIIKSTFKELKRIRVLKKNTILKKLKQVEFEALKVKDDAFLINFLIKTDEIQKVSKKMTDLSVLSKLHKSIQSFKYSINQKCILSYGMFYNVLFLNNDGDIIHRRRQDNYPYENMFAGDLAKTKLSKHLKSNSQNIFVEFDLYQPSNQPSAFFTIPVYNKKDDTKRLGWIVLQYSINNLNNIVLEKREIGETGEVLLVNENYYMLTNSKFEKNKSFTQRIKPEIIEYSLKNKSGEKIFKGYRGHNILSSFESFKMWGHQWVILSEIEVSEIITQSYLENQTYYLDKVTTILAKSSKQLIKKDLTKTNNLRRNDIGRVDMDQYKSSTDFKLLETTGITTCTGFLAYIPQKVAYIAHLSPYDKTYNTKNITNLVRHIIESSLYYDIPQSEIKNIRVIVVANHTKSIKRIILKLTSYGIFLSQVKFIYNPLFDYASLAYNSKSDFVNVAWHKDNLNKTFIQDILKFPTIEEIIKKVGHYNPGKNYTMI